jgi:hypothetical protein
MDTPVQETAEGGEYTRSRATKFRFKSKRSRSDKDDEHKSKRRHKSSEDEGSSKSHRSRHKHHHRSSRHKSRHTGPKDDPSLYDDTYLPNSRSANYADPEGLENYRESVVDGLGNASSYGGHVDADAAFRESLFDAMADDEGADFWEHVYGQPIHTYPNTKMGPQGELEKMTDEEYAQYVRGKMFERSHQHIFEERERREQQKKEEKRRQKLQEETEAMEEEHMAFQRDIEESLRRGEARKVAKQYKEAWDRYTLRWNTLRDKLSTSTEDLHDITIPWPVLSGRAKDIATEEVESFMRNAPVVDLPPLLKSERVKWHPDKIQQRFGNGSIDMKSVTAVFQIIDRMWSQYKKS